MIDEMRTQHAEDTAEITVEVFPETEMSPELYKKRLHALQKQLREIPQYLSRTEQSMMLVFEGWDASGKGGTIRRITDAIREDRIQVFPTGAPSAQEKARHYLWRFWRTVPAVGNIAIYDRSWYGRVLVERVEGFAGEAQWKRAYGEIRDFERTMTENGCILRKFWLEISPEEQLTRFRARQRNPAKQHKLTPEDWRNRSHRAEYETALADMLRETSTDCAPWEVIAADSKRHARLTVMEQILTAVRP
ncbi:MAG: hypothetical protein IJD06_06960 [Clostridia bacterium]|nr:hypothetical protein [Clostridia bacterium]